MKKFVTLVFASMIALALAMPAWSQSTTGTQKAPAAAKQEDKDSKKAASKKKKGDKKAASKKAKTDKNTKKDDTKKAATTK